MSGTMAGSEFDRRIAEQRWNELHQAMRADDDRSLWLAWKKYFPQRFWRDLGAPGVGALCREYGIEYGELLRRVTAYDMDATRDKEADQIQLERESQRPPKMS